MTERELDQIAGEIGEALDAERTARMLERVASAPHFRSVADLAACFGREVSQ